MTFTANKVDQLVKLVEMCYCTDYEDKELLKRHNLHTGKIRKIISDIKTEEELLELLDIQIISSWVAFQYLETPKRFSSAVDKKAKKVLKLLSKESSTEALVAKQVLKSLRWRFFKH